MSFGTDVEKNEGGGFGLVGEDGGDAKRVNGCVARGSKDLSASVEDMMGLWMVPSTMRDLYTIRWSRLAAIHM